MVYKLLISQPAESEETVRKFAAKLQPAENVVRVTQADKEMQANVEPAEKTVQANSYKLTDNLIII